MRRMHWILVLPIGLVTLVGCGSGPALLNSPDSGSALVQARRVSTKPSIGLSRGALSKRSLPSDGGPVHVGATVVLKNLSPTEVTVVANAVGKQKKVVATLAMSPGEKNIWRTPDPGLALPANYASRPVSYTIQVIATATGNPKLRRGLKAGVVTVAKSTSDPNLPPPPPAF